MYTKKMLYLCNIKFIIMFNSQRNKKIMKEETKKRIRKHVDKLEIDPLEEFKVLWYEENYVVLRRTNWLKIYIVNGTAYQERIPIYPLFSLTEIKEALTC